jgi:hypothetical protein
MTATNALAFTLCIEYHYADSRYVECHVSFIVILRVVMVSVVMLNVVTQSIIMLSVMAKTKERT